MVLRKDLGHDVVVSMYFTDDMGNPVVMCQLSAGSCKPTDSRFVVQHVGTYASGATSSFSYTLTAPGALLYLALVAVDASGYADGTADDFWVYWDNLSIQYSACSPPYGWSYSGYVWQSYNYLLVAGGVTYVKAVQNALTYVANFTGVGKYVALSSALGDVFGVYWRGAASGCVYGLNPPPASAKWTELRPLSGLGDVIVRDAYGNILARYGCPSPPSPTYIGFKTAPGELLKIYEVQAWGIG
ncbi:MAG: hypothetical protein ABWK05_06200 [Pyrobaculum sp.]